MNKMNIKEIDEENIKEMFGEKVKIGDEDIIDGTKVIFVTDRWGNWFATINKDDRRVIDSVFPPLDLIAQN